MGRKKIYSTNQLICFVNDYHEKFPQKKITPTGVARWCSSNGNKSERYTFFRDPDVKKHIDELNKSIIDNDIIPLSAYIPINAHDFVNKFSSKKSLIHAICERDLYYSNVAATSAIISEKYKKSKDEITKLKNEINNLKSELSKINSNLEKEKEKLSLEKTIHHENKILWKLLRDYLYPSIAFELLKKEGLNLDTVTFINESKFEKNIITPNTNIQKYTNSLVQSLEDDFKSKTKD